MSFADQIKQFVAKTKKDSDAIFVDSVVELERSITLGSAITGAPALPVASTQFPNAGELRDGVTLIYPDPNTAQIYTTVPYAVDVEDHVRGQRFTSGGPHGWKLSAAGWARIVAVVAKRLGST